MSKESYKKYLSGDKKGPESNKLEKEALANDFEQDALEGLDSLEGDQAVNDINDLSAQINHKTKESPGKDFWRIAAVIAFLVTTGVGFWIWVPEEDQLISQSLIEQEASNSLEEEANDSQYFADEESHEEVKMESATVPEEPKAEPDNAEESMPDQEEETIISEDEPDEIVVDVDLNTTEELTLAASSIVSEEEISEPILQETIEDGTEIEAAGIENEVAEFSAKSRALSSDALAKKADAPSETKTIKGKVMDQDGFSIPGVDVLLNGGSYSDVTDVEGNFEMTVPNLQALRLVYSAENYRPMEMPVSSDYVEVRLRSLRRSNVEIMVLGYGENNQVSLGNTPPEPIGGLQALEMFVNTNKQSIEEASGKVAYQVSLDEQGEIIKMELEKGLSEATDLETERVLKAWEGGWTPGLNRGRPVKSLVRIKVKFP